MFEFDQYLGFLAFLTIFTIGFWLMIFLITFVVPYWIGGTIMENMKLKKEAKKAVAVALRNRWRRQALKGEMKDEVLPKNILMIGPTGVGGR